jgi:hypothetical protein
LLFPANGGIERSKPRPIPDYVVASAPVGVGAAIVHNDLAVDPNVGGVQTILRDDVVMLIAVEIVQLIYPLANLFDLSVLTVDIDPLPAHRLPPALDVDPRVPKGDSMKLAPAMDLAR